ncbi:hypothetical protein ABKV19_010865 [Rosa sericea]
MASQDTGRPLPKFGEWDVNNPASAEGFTVIFSKARDQKMNNGPGNSKKHSFKPQNNSDDAPKKKLFCCF